MGLLDFLKPKPTVVRVVFRELTDPMPEPGHGGAYLYWWKPNFRPPQIGDRVRVASSMGGGHAVVIGLGASKREIAKFSPLQTVTWVVDSEEIREAHEKLRVATDAWLNMARREAGLKTSTRRKNPPKGFARIPPAAGKADASTADEWGRVWWKVANLARDEEESKVFKAVAYRWFAVRNKGGNLPPR